MYSRFIQITIASTQGNNGNSKSFDLSGTTIKAGHPNHL